MFVEVCTVALKAFAFGFAVAAAVALGLAYGFITGQELNRAIK
jgi:hypothetical protein